MTPENEINTYVKSTIDNSSSIQTLLPRGYITAYNQAPDNSRPPYFVYSLTKTERTEEVSSALLTIHGVFNRKDALVPQQVMQEITILFNKKTLNTPYIKACRFWLDTDVRESIIEKDDRALAETINMNVTFYLRWISGPVTSAEIYPA